MVIEIVLVSILLSVWITFYQILKQQGRILLRLDALEQQAPPSAPAEPQGLEVGIEFPAFTFSDLNGDPVSLARYRGKQVLLLHWSPKCGFCELVASDLAQVHAQLQENNTELLLLAYEDADDNRRLAEQHGLKCPILLYNDAPVPEHLVTQGTPSAYLLDEEGRVAEPLAVGSEEISILIRDALPGQKRRIGERPSSKSKIVRDGLKVGALAPNFALPDLNGRTISLDQYRGRRVLLVFSDPHCGPCDQVAAKLARFQDDQRDGDLQLILVGRGEATENRKKAEEHGIRFPVVLQDKWRLSKEYGIFATPVAFLIDEKSIIASDVAIGPDHIMALAEQGLAARKENEYELSVR